MNSTKNNSGSDNRDESKLRNDLHGLEEQTASQDLFRLAQARNNALSQSGLTKKRALWPVLGTSLASVALIAVLLNPAQETPSAVDISITDTEIDESLIELYDDLDFYNWLSSAET
jgi:hypothetical protein